MPQHAWLRSWAGPRVPPIRLLVTLLVVLQLAGPVTSAFADPPPTRAGHVDHLGTAGDDGCTPFHDDAACLSCRVLSLQPLRPAAAPGVPRLAVAREALAPDAPALRNRGPAASPLQARAPPRT